MFAIMGLGFVLKARITEPVFWGLSMYGLVPLVPLIAEQARYGEQPEARWLLAIGPQDDSRSLLRGVRKGVLTAGLLVPGVVLLAVLALGSGPRALLHGLVAAAVVLAVDLALVRTTRLELPFARSFRPSAGAANLGAFLVSMVVVAGLGLAHLLAARYWPVELLLLAIALPLARASWRRL